MAEREKSNLMNVLEKILEEMLNYERVVKTDEDLEWNRAMYRCSEIIRSHMNEAENDGWIPVEEGLPEEKTEVLCYFKNGTVQSLWQNWKNDGLGDYLDDDLIPTEVIAWKPLPEPYKPNKGNSATEHIMSRFMKVE